MAVVLPEDDRHYFIKFTNARKSIGLDADMMDEAHSVLLSTKLVVLLKFSPGTRLTAAKLLLCKDSDGGRMLLHQPYAEWIILTAMVEESAAERVVQIIKAWMTLFRKRRVGDSEEEIMFMSSLSKVLAKKGNHFRNYFAASEMKQLQRYLLITFVILYESEHGSKLFEGAVQFVAKVGLVDENLFDFCFHELAVHLRGRFSILEIFLRNASSSLCHKIESVIPSICTQLSYHLSSQLLSSAAANFVAELVDRFPTSSDIIQVFMRNILHHAKCVRFNVLRWLGRIKITKENTQFLLSLQRAISERFSFTSDDLWPPCNWEMEDVSCINPRWDDEEGEEILWQKDRVLNAYLNLSYVLNHRFGIKPDSKDPMILAGMKWHLPEIRLIAFQLWKTSLEEPLEDPENNSILEQFLLRNASSSLSSLREAVNVASELCTMSSHGKIEWMEKVDSLRKQYLLDEEQRGLSYLPKGITGTIPPFISVQSARERLEDCLQISGSYNSKSCPGFDVLYEKLNEAEYDHRVFARDLIDIINMLKCHEDFNTALVVISETVTRCRLKSVVDYGCSVIDELLSVHRCDENFLDLAESRYSWAMDLLMDKETQCRTLALSRILWSLCEKSQGLLKTSFETIRAALGNEPLDKRVHQRVLKTLKLFTSKSDCKLPEDFVEFLFWHCIDVQVQSDFLLRSAATILFGFVVRSITKSRLVPVFFVVSKRGKFWHEVMKRCSLLPTLTFLQRILLLTFLSHLTLGHVECYSAATLRTIHSLLVYLIELLNVTADIRERRFCLEIAVAMSPAAAHEELLKLQEEIHQDHTSRVDCEFLMFTIKTWYGVDQVKETRMVPYDLAQSSFVKTILRCETCAPEEALKEIGQAFSHVEPHSAELGLQALAMAMTRVAVNMKKMEDVNQLLRESFVEQTIAILEHPCCSSRAVSIISRIPVFLGLTTDYLQKYYVVQILNRWVNSNTT